MLYAFNRSTNETARGIMLEKPDLGDEKIISCLQQEYGLQLARLIFLPLGADLDTAVYRGTTHQEIDFFVKLRKGPFHRASVTLPRYLNDQGIQQVLAPLPSKTGMLWANLDSFKVIVYPYLNSRNAYEVDLTDHHWNELGATLGRIHTIALPASIANLIRCETYSPRWRSILRNLLAKLDPSGYQEPVAQELADYLHEKQHEILEIVQRSGQLAQLLQAQPAELTLCHSDLHAGNILVDDAGALYVIDWDAPVLAPKERDLMYAGGGQFRNVRSPAEEERLFYQGYGTTNIDHHALAYYRYERIVEDLAIYCEQLLLTNEGGDDRQQSLHYFKSNFQPGGTIEIARASDRTGRKKADE
jgi:spectinomycin phosphotransferase